MSGKFFRVFTLTLVCVITSFFLLYYISHTLKGWSAGQVFIQMINPSPTLEFMDGEGWFLIVCVNIFGLFVINGVLLTLLINWITNRRHRYLNGEARYGIVKSSRFSVIIGGHAIVPRLAADILRKDDLDYVIIMTRREPTELRREVHSQIFNRVSANKVVIYYGDRTVWDELNELNLGQAHSIYIIGEDGEIDKNGHDAKNLKCWRLIRTNISEPRNIKIPCHIFIADLTIFNIFQTTDVDLDDTGTFRFIPFNMEQCWARTVLTGSKSEESVSYQPLDGDDGISYESNKRVHLIITGSNFQAMALMAEAAQLNHYPNFLNPHLGHPKTLITIIDPDIRQRIREIKNRIPFLLELTSWRFVSYPVDCVTIEHHHPEAVYGYLGKNLTDIEFEFIEGDIEDSPVRQYLVTDGLNERIQNITTIAICNDDDSTALCKAMTLPEKLYDISHQILVRQQITSDIADGLRTGHTGKGQNRYRKLIPFGMKADLQYLNQADSMLYQYVHYAYSALSRKSTFMEEYKCAQNREHFDWKVKSEWLRMEQDGGKTCIAKRWSNRYSADNFFAKWRSVRNSVAEGEIIADSSVLLQLAHTEHNRWVMEQLLLGMRPPGIEFSLQIPIDDSQLRGNLKAQGIHPDLISYERLGSTAVYDEEIVKLIPFLLQF